MQIAITAVLLLALLPFFYYLLSLYCVIGYFRGTRKASAAKVSFMPPASILKPVRGLDHEAYENFASFCRLDYPEYEVLFAVSDIFRRLSSSILRQYCALNTIWEQQSIRGSLLSRLLRGSSRQE